MTWGAVAIAGASLVGGALQSRAGRQNAQTAQGMSEADRQFYQQQWANALRANRPNQTTDFGSSEWTQDDKGNWSQKVSLAAPEQARLGDYRQIAANRMAAAAGMDVTKPMRYDTTGYGSNAAANWTSQPGQFDPFASFKPQTPPTGYNPQLQGASQQYPGNTPTPAPTPAGPYQGLNMPTIDPSTLGTGGGAALGSPTNPAPVTPTPAPAPAPAPVAQTPAPAAAPDMDAIWKEMQARKAFQDNQWQLDSRNSSPGQ